MKIRTVASGVTLIALIVCTSYTSAAQQTKERVIKRLPVEQNEPLAITDIKVNGQSVSFDAKFFADDDWMRTLVFSIKNKSDKRILFVNLDLFFDRPQSSKDPGAMFDLLSYGNWALQRRPPTAGEQLVGIAPGETGEIGFSVQRFVDLTRFLIDAGFPPSVGKVDMRLGRVIFEDDTMWYAGSQFRRDPNNPSGWNNVSP